MADNTSKAILAKGIRLDRNYRNIINYSESNMVNLVTSKAVSSFNNCSFIRDMKNVVELEVAYGTALQADYIAFQNPDYSNKWFFAFIDKIEYRSEKNTRIYFTVDVCSTWYDYWTPQKCWVIREHANTDTAGDNLVPENLELGEYITNNSYENVILKNYGFIMTVSEVIEDDDPSVGYPIGGIWNPGGAYFYTEYSALAAKIQAYQGWKAEAITNIYVVPSAIVLNLQGQAATANAQWKGMNDPYTNTNTIAKLTALNGYTPVNKKLLTYPFCALSVENNNGSANIYRFEFFTSNTGNCTFKLIAVPTIGASIKLIPTEYKGVTDNHAEGLIAGKYPTLGWISDTYTNWLTQNGVNIAIGSVSDAASSLMNPSAGSVLGLAGSFAGTIGQMYAHQMLPNTIKGQTNAGDILSCAKMNTFIYKQLSITRDFAERIDQYFTRYGYATNKLKYPNQTGRSTFNYIQIGEGENIGYSSNTISVPPEAMETINNAYRSGVTVWHSHDNIGNFDLANGIVS